MKQLPTGVAAGALAVLLLSTPAHGQAIDATLDSTSAALQEGRYNDAVAELERLSDRGVRDANASFNRALAYLQRAESGKPRAGDLGQAAAGFREALILGDDSKETHSALERIRVAISEQRARRGLDPVIVEPSLGRAALQLVPETIWAACAMLASLTLATGLALWQKGTPSPRTLAGQIATWAGAIVLLLTATLAQLAAHKRTTEREAVVITTEAKMLDENGKRLTSRALDIDATAIPEGASVFVSEQRGRLAQVHWGSTQTWIELGQIRFVERGLQL